MVTWRYDRRGTKDQDHKAQPREWDVLEGQVRRCVRGELDSKVEFNHIFISRI